MARFDDTSSLRSSFPAKAVASRHAALSRRPTRKPARCGVRRAGDATTRGCFEATNRLTEDIAALLLEKWGDSEVRAIVPPVEPWALEEREPIDFEGFAPQQVPEREYEGRINPHDAERIRLADELQDARRVEEGVGPADG
jgi:hypothetical protein